MSWRERLGRNWGRLGMKFDTIKLSELAEIQTGPFGSQLHKEDYVVNGTPIVTVEHLGNRKFTEQNLPCVSDKDKERLKKYMLKTGDIVFSRVGSVDRCSYVSAEYEGWMFSGRCLRVRPCEILNSEYLYYFFSLKETKQFVRNIATGATMPSINTKFMGEVPIRVPSMEAQNKIASILWMIDDKIELNEKINNNLEQQAMALFKSWFIDFEPFDRQVPKTWINGVLGNFVEIKRGGSPRPIQNFLSDSGFHWLKISDATGITSPFINEIKEYIIEAGLKKTVYLKSGSLVLSNSATPGLPKILDIDTCIHDGWLYFPSSKFSNEYLYLYFKHIRDNLIALGNGSVFTNLKTDILKNYPTCLPTEDVLKKFDGLVQPIFSMILSKTREIKRLAEIRDMLLPKLMSGELDVSDIDL